MIVNGGQVHTGFQLYNKNPQAIVVRYAAALGRVPDSQRKAGVRPTFLVALAESGLSAETLILA